ncbi:WD40 repeat-like protein, partial [Vararia minispora EC-137]
IHPYAKMAVSIFTSLAKLVLAQDKRDKALKDLLNVITAVYAFANQYKNVEDLDEDRRKLLRDLSLQTVECAYFIRDQARIKSFSQRVGKSVLLGSQIDEQIAGYKVTFLDLRRQLTEHGVLEIELRVFKSLSEIGDTIEYHNLAHVRGAGLNSAKACLPGTRLRILDDLSTWINDPDGARVRFLVGVAGTGKSSIAHSLGSRFHTLRRLGCFFAFDRNFQGDRYPESVLSTIAHELAGWNASFKHALALALRENGTLSHTVDITAQWDGLLINPAKRVQFIGPVLIVVDAFDESSPINLSSRSRLLHHLMYDAKALPSNFRVLVTSRPEDDVRRALRTKLPLVDSVYLSPEDGEATSDIEIYVRHALRPQDPEDEPLDNARLCQIVQKAEGLFQWASTACRVILENPAGSSLRRRFDRRISSVIQGGSSLDGLYSSVLGTIFPTDDSEVMSRFQSVMAQILCSSQPLSMDALQSIRASASFGEKDDVTLVVRYMGALLSGVNDPASPIRPLHTSFRDFLTTSNRSHVWHVSPEDGHSVMSLGLVINMNKELRFNICDLETSYLRNSDIPGIQRRISSPVLSYAAGYLKDHLPPQSSGSPLNTSALPASLYELLCEKLLFWIELLSILGFIRTAPSVLRGAFMLLSASEQGGARKILLDAMRFVRRFAYPISQSAPHIYISALPFAPPMSITHAFLSSKYPCTPKTNGIAFNWSRTQAVIAANHSVYAVACSPDNRHIASGARDSSVRIWDADTGEAVGNPFLGHTSLVWSVAYSPDGSFIISGADDGSVCIWDARTSETVCEPIHGHSKGVYTVSFSPDNKHALSASSDCTLRIWDSKSGKPIGEPIRHSSPVWAAAYSLDGTLVVSGSVDGRIHFWDVTTRKSTKEPLRGHSAAVTSVAFSPDGSRIASSSYDLTVRIWDVVTGAALYGPLCGHSSRVRSVAYSPDGRHVASSSFDSTICVWDAETGKPTCEPFQGHSGTVYSVTYSPDGRHIISGSFDGTVRIWDTTDVDGAEWEPSDNQAAVNSVAYSPDGHHIVSGHSDGTVRIWNPETGDAVGEPLSDHSAAVLSVAYSIDGRHILSGSSDKSARIWSMDTKRAIGSPLRGHPNSLYSVNYSPDGLRIVTGSADSTIRIWDASTGQPIGTPLLGHSDKVFSVAYSPDGLYIASGSKDSTMRIWDASTETPTSVEPIRGHTDAITAIAYSPDSRRIVSGSWDKTVRIWDAIAGKAVSEPFRGHSEAVLSVAYSPDGRYIVSSSNDMSVRIWDADTGDAVGEPLRGQFGDVKSVEYSQDGRVIVSGSDDGTIRIWDVDHGKESSKVRSIEPCICLPKVCYDNPY